MVTLGNLPGPLTLGLDPAADFVGRIELRTATGTPTPWPAGTEAWIQLTLQGSDFEQIWPANITGSLMEWSVPGADVAEVPRRAWAELWLDYPDSPAVRWLAGNIAWDCTRPGFGYVAAVPGDGPGVVAVPVPGPTGLPGDAATSRVVLTGIAAVPLGGHRAVYRNGSGQIDYASCTIAAHMNVPIWVTLGAAAAGDTVSMMALGEIEEPSWSWTAGSVIFLGTAGALVQTVPVGADFLAVLGTAPTSNTMYVDRQPSVDLI